MATSTKGKAKAAPATPDVAFEVEESDLDLRVNRVEKPNPLAGHVRQSLDQDKALQVAHNGDDQRAREIENYLKRAAKKLGCGLSVRRTPTHVAFQARSDKRGRNYSADDVRAWAEQQGVARELLYPRIDERVRKAYRVEYGYEKADEGGTPNVLG